MNKLVEIIQSDVPAIRNAALDEYCAGLSIRELLQACQALEHMRKTSDNLYERVRALFFLHAIHRYYLPLQGDFNRKGKIPFIGFEHLLQRRFEESIEVFLGQQEIHGSNEALSSALAEAYRKLAFQTLADQVKQSVRSTFGNQWMFRTGHPEDHPLRVRTPLLEKDPNYMLYPIVHECTPVRMDISHSGWSDIFFLGMDYPEGANVCNISIDLSIWDSAVAADPRPPIETYFRVIDEPVIRLTSIDLDTSTTITELSDIFDFAKDYLGLLKAALIASGLIPAGMEGAGNPLSDILGRLVGPGLGIELVSQVNGIPKGSRLAVSTNLLASLITVCMRATNQVQSLEGSLSESERRMVAARAILGEWLGGSGGGWQDSGGVWPGIKLIQGVMSGEGDPEYGISRGRLLPRHTILDQGAVSAETRNKLQRSLVLVHGGMAQDVGPILEMVTEKYLLRSSREWKARQQAIEIFGKLVDLLKAGDIRSVGQYTQENFESPIQSIIPWASNLYTEQLIAAMKEIYGRDFWGFWMLGGMAGGGMGFIFDPDKKAEAQQVLKDTMVRIKCEMESGVPFAMDPVVYDFSVNEAGTSSNLHVGAHAILPTGYYAIRVPGILKKDLQEISLNQRHELERLGELCNTEDRYSGFVSILFDRMIPQSDREENTKYTLKQLLEENGFDAGFHEQIKADLKRGRIGLAQNRISVSANIEDVSEQEVFNAMERLDGKYEALGAEALKNGELAIVSLAGGAGSRWTKGAGVVKSLNPFVKMQGKYRNFIEIHLAKSRKVSTATNQALPHIFTTSYLTHQALDDHLQAQNNYDYPGPLYLSRGKSIGLRLVPMERDLRFEWEEMPQQLLDEQAQKMQESVHNALIGWARSMGEGEDYTDNLPAQCVHPVGHWYEVPNLFLNGTLLKLLTEQPALKYLMIHNIDTLGANADPALLGWHIHSGKVMNTEVITRRLEDRGGGLAKINGTLRLVEGMALPDEKIEFQLSYYNSSTTWVDIDQLLQVFGLTKDALKDRETVQKAVRTVANRMPTYITIKDVKKRWGKGQEDVFPVAQFEKLWGDMTALAGLNCGFMLVPRMRGQQLKEISQLDGWLRDGSADYVNSLCNWDN